MVLIFALFPLAILLYVYEILHTIWETQNWFAKTQNYRNKVLLKIIYEKRGNKKIVPELHQG
jgi:hypothetical protein